MWVLVDSLGMTWSEERGGVKQGLERVVCPAVVPPPSLPPSFSPSLSVFGRAQVSDHADHTLRECDQDVVLVVLC